MYLRTAGSLISPEARKRRLMAKLWQAWVLGWEAAWPDTGFCGAEKVWLAANAEDAHCMQFRNRLIDTQSKCLP